MQLAFGHQPPLAICDGAKRSQKSSASHVRSDHTLAATCQQRKIVWQVPKGLGSCDTLLVGVLPEAPYSGDKKTPRQVDTRTGIASEMKLQPEDTHKRRCLQRRMAEVAGNIGSLELLGRDGGGSPNQPGSFLRSDIESIILLPLLDSHWASACMSAQVVFDEARLLQALECFTQSHHSRIGRFILNGIC